MHRIKLSDVNHSATKLTQAVLQVTDMLGLYRAELARILVLQCSDVGDLYCTGNYIQKGSRSWQYAESLIKVYEILYEKFSANEAMIYHWLRKENKALAGAPLYIMVDQQKIEEVLFFVSHNDMTGWRED